MSNEVKKMSLAELIEHVATLEARIVKLEESNKPRNESQREMTDEDALKIMNGELKDMKHKEAADKLGLSYGQVYSCRLQFTFKAIHKKLAESGYKNPWVK